MTDPKPIVLVYNTDPKKDSNAVLKKAEMPAETFEKGFEGQDKRTGKQTFKRQSSGLYNHETDAPPPMVTASAIDAFDFAKSELAYIKDTKAALIIKDEKGNVLHTLNNKEAAAFLKNEKTRELSQDRSVKDLKDIIGKLAKSGGGLDENERDSIEQYAATHNLKLDYTEVKGGLDSIQIQNKRGTTLDSVKKINIDGNAR